MSRKRKIHKHLDATLEEVLSVVANNPVDPKTKKFKKNKNKKDPIILLK